MLWFLIVACGGLNPGGEVQFVAKPSSFTGNSLGSTQRLTSLSTTKEAVKTLCSEDEEVIFHCTFKNKKKASLCLSPKLLQYRFGQIGAVELQFPSKADPDWPELFGAKVHRGDHSVIFSNGSYSYDIAVGTFPNGVQSGWLTVYKDHKEIASLPCDGQKELVNELLLVSNQVREHRDFSFAGWEGEWKRPDESVVITADEGRLRLTLQNGGVVYFQGWLTGAGTVRHSKADGCEMNITLKRDHSLSVDLNGAQCPLTFDGAWKR